MGPSSFQQVRLTRKLAGTTQLDNAGLRNKTYDGLHAAQLVILAARLGQACCMDPDRRVNHSMLLQNPMSMTDRSCSIHPPCVTAEGDVIIPTVFPVA